MKAVVWVAKNQVAVESVPEPVILNPRDAIIRVTLTTICGSDLHLYDGAIPGMRPGDILGHETVGEVVEIGSAVAKLKTGDRVVVMPIVSCGGCWYCQRGEFGLCDNSNPNAHLWDKVRSCPPAAILGHTQLLGGYAGSQAQYLRVPFADVGAIPVPNGMTDEQALACSDIFPTGLMAADYCDIQPGDTVAVWGCGPVGLFAIQSAYLLGAHRVVAIDSVPERLEMAERLCKATLLNPQQVQLADYLYDLTGGRGPDACIDAVGMEAHGTDMLTAAYDRIKQAAMLETDRAHVLRQIMQCCRKGGVLSIVGAYTGIADKIPIGLAFTKGLRIRMGLMNGHKYVPQLFDYWHTGRIDPAFVYTHRLPLDAAPDAYEMFNDKRDGCIKVTLQP